MQVRVRQNHANLTHMCVISFAVGVRSISLLCECKHTTIFETCKYFSKIFQKIWKLKNIPYLCCMETMIEPYNEPDMLTQIAFLKGELTSRDIQEIAYQEKVSEVTVKNYLKESLQFPSLATARAIIVRGVNIVESRING